MHYISSGRQKRGHMYNIKSRMQKTGICIILAVVGKKGAYALYFQW